MMVGALSHATIFGHVTNIVQRIYARRSEYDAKWRDLKHFTEVHNVPKQLKQRMQDYFQTVWSINHGIDVSQVSSIVNGFITLNNNQAIQGESFVGLFLSDILSIVAQPLNLNKLQLSITSLHFLYQVLTDYPEELRGDVSLHLHKEVLSLPLFQSASQGCLKSMSLTIKTSFCAPDEFLVHSGDVVQNIFYLSSGSMEVVQDGMVVALLGKGDLVGCDIPVQNSPDAAILGAPVVKSSADVRALTYCFLECIQVPELLQVLKLHTDFRDQFANDIQHDLTYNLREGFEQDDDEVLLHRSRLPSISEQSDVSAEREVSLKSPIARSNSSANMDLQINRIKTEVKF